MFVGYVLPLVGVAVASRGAGETREGMDPPTTGGVLECFKFGSVWVESELVAPVYGRMGLGLDS